MLSRCPPLASVCLLYTSISRKRTVYSDSIQKLDGKEFLTARGRLDTLEFIGVYLCVFMLGTKMCIRDRVYAVIGVELEGGDMIKPNDKNVLNIIAEETSYRLGDMGHR